MVEYNCPRCGYLTKKKPRMKDHLFNRKNKCKPILNNIDLENYIIDIMNGIDLIPILKVEELENQVEELKNNQLSSSSSTINNTTNNHNNTTNNIGNIINNTINIKIDLNSFKNPSMAHITEKEILELIREGDIFTKIFPRIYLDKDAPENHSIICTNNRSGTIQMYDEQEYKLVPVKKAKEDIDENLQRILTDIADDWGDKNIYPKAQDKFANQYNERSNEKVKKEQQKQWMLDAYNNRDITVPTMKKVKKTESKKELIE